MLPMRRIGRHVLTILSVLSLLLCFAVCLLWVRSYLWTERIVYHQGDHMRCLQSGRGEVLVQVEADSLSQISADRFRLEHEPSGSPAWARGFYDLRGISFPLSPKRITLREWGGFWWCTMRDPKEI